MSIRGSVDSLTSDGAAGWLFTGDGRPAVVQAMVNGRIVGEALADQHRHDLASAGLGDGRCGFTMTFSTPLDPLMLALVSFKPQDGDVELPRTNLTGFFDYLRAFRSKHPGNAWTASVFGGLWTDRADALRVLAGRATIGITPLEVEPVLRQFIAEGYAQLRSVLAPVGYQAADVADLELLDSGRPLLPNMGEEARRILDATPSVMFRDGVLRMLRAILDDNPTVYRLSLERGVNPFSQASNLESLPSPTECLALVGCIGGDRVTVDLVAQSHSLPEFSEGGFSRWVHGVAAGIEVAVANGASLTSVDLGPSDLTLIGPGTIYRVRTPDGSTAVQALICPARQTPTHFLGGQTGTYSVRHFSGASLIA
jgi:hypothetical protein